MTVPTVSGKAKDACATPVHPHTARPQDMPISAYRSTFIIITLPLVL
ncbi:MAG: hypothetical protein WCC36_04455 [Gammaproteobacteria bacterium]